MTDNAPETPEMIAERMSFEIFPIENNDVRVKNIDEAREKFDDGFIFKWAYDIERHRLICWVSYGAGKNHPEVDSNSYRAGNYGQYSKDNPTHFSLNCELSKEYKEAINVKLRKIFFNN